MRRMGVMIGLGLLLACGAASGQIVVNQQALRQLSGKPLIHKPIVRRPFVRRPVRPLVRRPVVVRPLPLPPPPPPVRVVVAPPPPKPPPPPPRALTLLYPRVAVGLDGGQSKALTAFIGAKLNTAAHFIVQATAPGVASDPTVARRMSLNRGLAVRAVLRRAGVASDHIIVQALGDPAGIAPDHVTLTEIP